MASNPFPSESASKGSPMQQKPSLTRDEMRVLQECNTESFWYRCLLKSHECMDSAILVEILMSPVLSCLSVTELGILVYFTMLSVPLSVLFVGTTQILVNKGFIPPNPRFGALFKNMGAVLVAYVIGKVSYQGACREKIMRLENSPLAEAMRKGKRGTGLLQNLSLPGTGFSDETQQDMSTEDGIMHGTIADDHYHAGDIDTDQNVQYKGLDDTLRPSIDRDSSTIMRQQRKEETFVSYRDLQKRNRDEYSQKMATIQRPPAREQTPYPQGPAPPPSSSDAYSSFDVKADESARTAPMPSRPQQQPTKYVRRNKFGDIVED